MLYLGSTFSPNVKPTHKMKTYSFLLFLLCFSISFTAINSQSRGRQVSVKLEQALVVSNNHVGHDWTMYLKIGKLAIREGETTTIQLSKRAPLRIEAHAIEEDRDYPDAGTKALELSYSNVIAIEKNRFEIEVTVIENGGQYAGNLAIIKFLVLIKKED